jgi:rhamnulokinase
VDLGASSGRVILGAWDGEHLRLQELHRFANGPVEKDGALRWDFEGLLQEVKKGLALGVQKAREHGGEAASVGVDSWGVDYGLLDAEGRLLEAPYHYRDQRNDGMMDWVFDRVPKAEVFKHSGIQFLPFNTIYQLAAETKAGGEKFERAACLLMIPDLFHYFLTGKAANEFSNASTTQLLNPLSRDWDPLLLDKLEIPRRLFPDLLQPGRMLGPVSPAMSEALGSRELQVAVVATHDTGSAVAAVPATDGDFAYLVCGTWSLLGTEVIQPVLGPRALELNFTNEGGVFDTWRLLKNCMGLWILQETQRHWGSQGRGYDWQELTALAQSAPAFAHQIDPDDVRFLKPGDMPARIEAACLASGQTAPPDDAALLRCILESLALKYRVLLGQLQDLSGKKFSVLHMVGGGIQNQLLCQWTADSCGLPVLAGPVEASALGNLLMQMKAGGVLDTHAALRAAVAASFPPQRFQPQDEAAWDQAFQRYKQRFKL